MQLGVLAIAAAYPAYWLYAQSSFIAPNTANMQPVALSADPLYAQGSGQKPTLTLALSVEFPTVGAQYRDAYTVAKTYLGYFDADSCYNYANATEEDDRRFERTGAAKDHDCGGASFSGNFMNWATSSSIDLLRYGLTGGDRISDSDNLTVLQRAVLQKDFWNSGSYFPQKQINSTLAAGALPSALRGTHKNTIYISNCLNRVFFSNSSSTGNCDNPTYANSLGAQKAKSSAKLPSGSSILSTDMFFARVKVCESTGNTLSDPRTGLCQKYPNGNFKPVGNMQKYSDRIRLSAFGYLMENGTPRYGGVLRAPMTYVGSRAYDANGAALATINPYSEWNANTGVFHPNPREDALGRSGVTNYLNQFGRLPGYAGVYKSNDPVSELYYESLRYLQGLQPTKEATEGMADSHKAGFPVYTQWEDPFAGSSSAQDYACLRNSILLIGDVNTHADKSLPGNKRAANNDFERNSNVASNEPNFLDWTKIVGGFESNNDAPYTDGNGKPQNTQTFPAPSSNTARWGMETQNTGSGGSSAYYMAGAAYWAHTQDIRGEKWTAEPTKQRPGMRITTYVMDVNEGGAQSTFNTRKNSQFYLTAKYGGFIDTDGDGNPFTPTSTTDPQGTSHWAKDNSAAGQPDPKTYFLVNDAEAVLKALDEIFIAATQVSSSIAKPALSSSKLTTTDNYVYQADFDPEYWSGDVKRRTLKLNATGGVEMSAEAQSVSAAARLDATAPDDRKIYAGKTGDTTTGYATAFTWSGIETALQEMLDKVDSTSQADGNGQNRLNFLRGDRSLEADIFRRRGSVLGDIVNSGVAYSGAPSTQYTDASYRSFYAANKDRTPAVFVGANDGMLHAFNASTMQELFAYIPSWMGPKLSTLTATDYNSSRHTSYVDATPVVAEAQIGNNWKTVLVSGTGAGGQGVFALDVTSATNFDADKVLWEFTDADDSSLGNVMGQPRVLKFRTNATAPATEAATYKWFAVVPSGVNNYVEDEPGRFSTTGEPALFLLDLSKPASQAWALGDNYFKFTFPVLREQNLGLADANNTAKAAGIINFEATGSSDGSVENIYVGDLHGQLWKLGMNQINLRSTQASSWNLDKASYYKSSSQARPMYLARTAAGLAQPISMVPTVAYGPQGSYIIGFGTGKYQEASDNAINTATLTQSFYVLYDQPDSELDTVDTATDYRARFKGRARLKQATVSGQSIDSGSFTWVAPRNAKADTNAYAGWYMDYPKSGAIGGEQQVTNAVLFGKDIIFNSLMPPTASGSACGGGSSYTYTANLATGMGSVSTLSAGALGAPLLLQISSTYGSSGATGDRIRTDKAGILNPSATGLGDSVSTKDADFLVGRLSWRQINNYQELKQTWPAN